MPQSQPAPYSTEEAGIECSPGACAKACGGCLMFLISLSAISALGVIAGGSFWTAQSMYRVTDGGNKVNVRWCKTLTTAPTEWAANSAMWGALHPCPTAT